MRRTYFLSDKAQKILNQFTHIDLDYGRGHIVWADGNLDDDDIKWCIEQPRSPGVDETEDEDAKYALELLLEIPEAERYAPGYPEAWEQGE